MTEKSGVTCKEILPHALLFESYKAINQLPHHLASLMLGNGVLILFIHFMEREWYNLDSPKFACVVQMLILQPGCIKNFLS